jgi:FMN reductase
MTERKIVAVTAGLGVPSSSRLLTDAIAKAVSGELTREGIVSSVAIYELRDYAVDIAYNMTNGFASPRLSEVIKALEEADLLIAVTPVFTAGMSGLFKSFFDVLDNKALVGKPVVIGATGGSSRHSLVLDYAMRPMFAYLKATVLPTSVFAAPEDWGASEATALNTRISRISKEAVSALESLPVVKVVKDNTSLPFEQLLANITASR